MTGGLVIANKLRNGLLLFAVLGVLLANVGICAVGTLLAAMAAASRTRELILPLLFLPLAIPLVVGGVGSIWGVIVSAAVLTLLPEFVRVANDYKIFIYGVLLVLTMRFAPGGLAGLVDSLRRKGGGAA